MALPQTPSPSPLRRPSPHVALIVETSLASGRDVLRGIARYVRERGPWSLYHTPRSLEESTPAWIQRWKGDGIIARVSTPSMAALLARSRLPVVDVFGLVPGASFPLVHVDDEKIGRLAFEHLASRGFRHFAFFGIEGENWSQKRRDGFLTEARTLDPSPGLLETPASARETMAWERRQDRLAAWVKMLPTPVGIMVCSDQRGSDLLEACRRVNRAVPDEVAVVGVDNDEPLCEVCHPPLSSIWPDHSAVGYEAAALLDQLMQGGFAPAEPRFIAPRTLITRPSSDVLAIADRAVATALKFIRDHACEGISADDVARASGTSRSVLQRRFREHLGQTIHDQLVQARLKRATELIASTDLSLSAIAERSGFGHQEYMGAVFRSRLGRTPGAHRQESVAGRRAAK